MTIIYVILCYIELIPSYSYLFTSQFLEEYVVEYGMPTSPALMQELQSGLMNAAQMYVTLRIPSLSFSFFLSFSLSLLLFLITLSRSLSSFFSLFSLPLSFSRSLLPFSLFLSVSLISLPLLFFLRLLQFFLS